MGEKPEVLDAVLKETVDLVMDLTGKDQIFVNESFVGFNGVVSSFVAVVIAGEYTHWRSFWKFEMYQRGSY